MTRHFLIALLALLTATPAFSAPATTQATNAAALAAIEAGRKLAEEGNHVAAIARYDEALRLDPSSAIAWAHKAASLSASGGLDEAVAAIDQAINLKPDDYRFRQLAGQIHIKQGQIQQGQQLYEQAAKLAPSHVGEIYNDLAAALSGRQDEKLNPQIENALKVAVAANPPSLDALFALGQSYAQAGRQEGKTYLQRYVDAASKLPESQQEPQKIRLARQLIRALDAIRDLPR